MYEVSEAFHRQYTDMYDKFVRIHFKDGSVRTGTSLQFLLHHTKKSAPFTKRTNPTHKSKI